MAGARTARSVADTNTENVYFTGITEEQAYGSFTLSASATWQAGEYIKFTAGSAFTYAQSHLVTAADTCTPGNTDARPGRPVQPSSDGAVLGAPTPTTATSSTCPATASRSTTRRSWTCGSCGVVMF